MHPPDSDSIRRGWQLIATALALHGIGVIALLVTAENPSAWPWPFLPLLAGHVLIVTGSAWIARGRGHAALLGVALSFVAGPLGPLLLAFFEPRDPARWL